MGKVVFDIDANDRITYSAPGFKQLTLYRPDLIEAAFTARDWHGGQWTGLYALSCGSFDYETVCRAANEFEVALRKAAMAGYQADADEIADAENARLTLERVSSFDFGGDTAK